MRVFLQSRPASCRIGNDRVEILGQECIEIPTSEIARYVTYARVRRKRSATSLRRRHDDLQAIRLQHANRRAIQFAESDLRHASGKKRHTCASLAPRWKGLAQLTEEKLRINRRQQLLPVLQTQQAQDARPASERSESRALINFQAARRRGNSGGVGKQPPVN